MEGVEPTYDYIENTYSCVIIDKDLFGLLSDEELDFIINYDTEYRMGDELNEE